MPRGLRLRGLVALFAGLLLAVPAATAAILQVNYIGRVTDGFDQIRLFAPGDLVGRRFVTRYTIDTEKGLNVIGNGTISNFGGFQHISESPIIAAEVFVGDRWTGLPAIFFGGFVSEDAAVKGTGLLRHQADYLIIEIDRAMRMESRISGFTPGFPANPLVPFSYVLAPGDFGEQVFWEQRRDDMLGITDVTRITGTVERVTVSAAIPEPSTWAMMLIGFAALARVRRRRLAYISRKG